jgi:hypothetical protein
MRRLPAEALLPMDIVRWILSFAGSFQSPACINALF